jgi:hypothetical protein
MKKILFTSVFSIVIIVANAQVNKGSILLGGNFGGNISKTENGTSETKNRSWTFNPSLGFVYKTNRVFGVSLGYANSSNRSTTPIGIIIDRGNNFSGGVYLRRYFPFAKSFSLFGQGDFNIGYSRSNATHPSGFNYIQKGYGATLSFSPGISYTLSKRIMLETSYSNLFAIYYNRSTKNYTGTSTLPTEKTSNLNFNGTAFPGGTLGLGFRFVLGNK